MIELVKSSVVFSEENHTYFLGEKQLKGITGMISRQLFPNKYKDIPEYILKKMYYSVIIIPHIFRECKQIFGIRVR